MATEMTQRAKEARDADDMWWNTQAVDFLENQVLALIKTEADAGKNEAYINAREIMRSHMNARHSTEQLLTVIRTVVSNLKSQGFKAWMIRDAASTRALNCICSTEDHDEVIHVKWT